MKIGIVGYQGSGKSTLFHWLTGTAQFQFRKSPVPSRVNQHTALIKLWEERAGFGRMNRSITFCAATKSLSKKVAYVLENPVRAGLVARPQDYRWLWWNQTVVD